MRARHTFFTANWALVKPPCMNFKNALALDPNHQLPDMDKVYKESAEYIHGLQSMGVQVKVCPPSEDLPDSNFVEDTHLILDELVIELNPGAISRQKEPERLTEYLPSHLPLIVLSKEFTMDGGDVLRDLDKLYIGISHRTQKEAINELADILEPYGYEVEAIKVPEGLHLKSGMTGMLPDHFIIQAAYEDIMRSLQADNPDIKYFIVPPEEAYAANVLPVNGKIMIAEGCPQTLAYIRQFYAEEDILVRSTTEARKVDGALTCSSLLFSIPESESEPVPVPETPGFSM